MAVRQQALTVVAPVRANLRAGLSARLDAVESDVQEALVGVKSLHFARFVLIGGPGGPFTRLAFESNHDGERGPHLEELAHALAPFEDLLFGSWAGYDKGDLAGFVDKHAQPASTYYLGHPGLTATQILKDREVRATLETLLDDELRGMDCEGESSIALRERILDRLRKTNIEIAPVDRGLPVEPITAISFWAIIVVIVIVAFVTLPIWVPVVLLVELWERRTEKPRDLVAEDDPRLDAINLREDAISQNGLTHYVALRPGPIRRLLFKAVLAFLELARKKIAYSGTLGDISSIHFGRWVLLDDDTVLFFSNYDGSWESYLGDFVDKAHIYLSAVWSNTRWFPDTNLLIFGGASKELMFKRWTRTFQVENRIWYSAYKNLTVQDVLRNALVREGASGEMDEEQARAWLARL